MVTRLKNFMQAGKQKHNSSKQGLNINEEVGRLAIVCDIVACAISILIYHIDYYNEMEHAVEVLVVNPVKILKHICNLQNTVYVWKSSLD